MRRTRYQIIEKCGKMVSGVITYIKNICKGDMVMFRLNNQKFEKHLNEKWQNKICPMCHSNEWSYDNTIFTPMTVGPNREMAVGGKFLPLVAVTCVNCGNTVFVNGLIAKAIDDDQKITGV